MTNFRSLSDLFKAAGKLAAASAFATAMAVAASAQTNTFPASGNVGIGTTNPSTKLQVQQDVNADNSIYVLNNGGGTSSRSLILFGEAANDAKYAYFGHFGANYAGSGPAQPRATLFVGADAGGFNLVSYGGASETGGKVSFWTAPVAAGGGNAAVAERMRITSNGFVGIGTINPLYSLDVNGGVNGFRTKATTTSSSDAVATFENSSGIQAIIRGNGNVGIGTANPAYRLHLRAGNGSGLFGDATTSQLFYQIRPDAGKQGWLAFTEDGVADRWAIGIKNGDAKLYFSAGNLSSLADRMSLDANGNLSVTGNIAAKYQDVAEWVPSSEQLSAGTVVVLDTTKSNQVISSTVGYDTRVAGVISAQPGITLGEGGEGKVLVATTGRVRVKVDASRAPIQIGDLLVTSEVPGFAMKSEALHLGGVQIHRPGTIIGKALEPLVKGTGEILVLLSLQ